MVIFNIHVYKIVCPCLMIYIYICIYIDTHIYIYIHKIYVCCLLTLKTLQKNQKFSECEAQMACTGLDLKKYLFSLACLMLGHTKNVFFAQGLAAKSVEKIKPGPVDTQNRHRSQVGINLQPGALNWEGWPPCGSPENRASGFPQWSPSLATGPSPETPEATSSSRSLGYHLVFGVLNGFVIWWFQASCFADHPNLSMVK